MRLTLRQLRVFDAIARSGSVSKASTTIALSQSAASMALRALEQNIGSRLFERRGRRLLLSELGRRYQPIVHALLRQAEELESLPREPTLSGRLRIGASFTIGNYILPDVCGRFLCENPEVRIELAIGGSEAIARQLDAMEIDIGFVENRLFISKMRSTPWIEDEMLFFCAPGHPLSRKRKVFMKDLADCVWTVGTNPSPVAAELTRHLHTVKVGMQTAGIEAIKRVVSITNGVGCLSCFSLESELRDRSLLRLPVEKPKLVRRLCIVTREQGYQGKLPERFLEFAAAPAIMATFADQMSRIVKPRHRIGIGD